MNGGFARKKKIFEAAAGIALTGQRSEGFSDFTLAHRLRRAGGESSAEVSGLLLQGDQFRQIADAGGNHVDSDALLLQSTLND